MPYADPIKRNAAARKRRAKKRRAKEAALRASTPPHPTGPDEPGEIAPLALSTSEDALGILREQIGAVRRDRTSNALARARVVGYLVQVSMSAIELVDVAARVTALEKALKPKADPITGRAP